MKNTDAKQSWKQKYYDSLDELENKEDQWAEIEALLRNIVVKMSLALDGIEQKFDEKLLHLRRVFRSRPSQFEIKTMIDSITASLDEIEQAKQNQQANDNQLVLFVQSILDGIDFPTQYGKAAKVLRKELQAVDAEKRLEPILGQLRILLVAVVDYYRKHSSAKGTGSFGFLSNVFKSESKKKTNEKYTSQEMETEDKANIDLSDKLRSGIDVLKLITQKLNWHTAKNSNFRIDLDNIDTINSGQALLENAEQLVSVINLMYRSDSNDQHAVDAHQSIEQNADLSAALVSLLEKIDLPKNYYEEITDLRLRLQQKLGKYDWPEVIEKIADLVAIFRKQVNSDRLEFEKYLASITNRLQEIENSLVGVDSNRKFAFEQSKQLDVMMNKEVADIREQMKSNSDINPLKQAIENRLQAIIVHMQNYREMENDRNQQAMQTISELTERINSLEQESRELQQKVINQRELAMQDSLTGIANRLAYNQRLEQEYRRWRRFHDDLSLIIIDIDHFKKINDNYGHKAGDRVLIKIAQVIASRLRETDFLARYGGEEFVILFSGANLANTENIANQIRESIAACGFHFRQESVPITVSIGLAEFKDNDTPEDVFERADRALYQAKSSGRNCCCK